MIKKNDNEFFLKINQLIWQKPYLQKSRNLFYYFDFFLFFGTKGKEKNKNGNDARKKVIVVYNLALGDAIMFLGVAKRLREIYPAREYYLSFLCENMNKVLFENLELFDEVITCNFKESIINLNKRRALFKRLRKQKYDILYDPVGCEECTFNVYISRAVRADIKIGVFDNTLKANTWFEKKRCKIYSEIICLNVPKMHLIEYYANALYELGAKDNIPSLASIAPIQLNFELPNDYFIIFPTASMDVKKWESSKFAEVAKRIYAKTKRKLLVCGTKLDEKSINAFLKYIPDIPTVNLVGKTNMKEFIEVIGRSSLIVKFETKR